MIMNKAILEDFLSRDEFKKGKQILEDSSVQLIVQSLSSAIKMACMSDLADAVPKELVKKYTKFRKELESGIYNERIRQWLREI